MVLENLDPFVCVGVQEHIELDEEEQQQLQQSASQQCRVFVALGRVDGWMDRWINEWTGMAGRLDRKVSQTHPFSVYQFVCGGVSFCLIGISGWWMTQR